MIRCQAYCIELYCVFILCTISPYIAWLKGLITTLTDCQENDTPLTERERLKDNPFINVLRERTQWQETNNFQWSSEYRRFRTMEVSSQKLGGFVPKLGGFIPNIFNIYSFNIYQFATDFMTFIVHTLKSRHLVTV